MSCMRGPTPEELQRHHESVLRADQQKAGKAFAIVQWVIAHQDEIDAAPLGTLTFDWGTEGTVRPKLLHHYPPVRTGANGTGTGAGTPYSPTRVPT